MRSPKSKWRKFLPSAGIVLGATAGLVCGQVETFTQLPAEYSRHHLDQHRWPTYLDCQKDKVVVLPAGVTLPAQTLLEPDSELRKLLDGIEAATNQQYLVVLQRPGSARTFAAVYRAIHLRHFEVARELLDADSTVNDAVKRPDFILGALSPPLDKQPVFFECRNNQLFYVSKDELTTRVLQYIQQFRPLSHREDIERAEQNLERNEFADDNYVIDGKQVLVGMIRLRGRTGARGETADEAEVAASKFRTKLHDLNKRQRFVIFLTRDDSFALARRARAIAENEGFDWRIQLLEGGQPLEFGQ
jgi:hypothetical protein